MPNKKPGAFEGKKVVFATTNDPSKLAPYAGPDRVAAVMPGATAEQVAALKAAGYSDVVLWDPSPSANTAAEVKKLGVSGVILQAEGPDQLEGSNQAAAGLEGSGVTIALVTNNFMPAYPDYVDVAMPEAYSGTNPQATVGNVVGDAQRLGAPPTIMPVIGGDSPNPDQAAAAAAMGGYGVFPPDINTTGQVNPMLAPTLSTSSTSSIPTVSPAETATTSISSVQPASNTSAGTTSSPPQQTDVSSSGGFGPSKPSKPGIGDSSGPLQTDSSSNGGYPPTGEGIGVEKPLEEVESKGYKGQSLNTYSFTDAQGNDNTLSFRPSGVVVQTKEDGSSFVVWDPSQNGGEHWPGFENNGIPDPYAGQTATSTTTTEATHLPVDITPSNPTNDVPNLPSSEPTLPPSGSTQNTHFGASYDGGNTVPSSGVVDIMSGLGGSSSVNDEAAVSHHSEKKKKKTRSNYEGATNPGVGDGSSLPPESNPFGAIVGDTNIGGSCFIAGTKILTPNGEKAIEEIKVGDTVQSWDLDKKQMTPANVIETFAHSDKQTLKLVTEGGSVTTTAEHRFWTGSEWLAAGKLVPHASSVFNSSGKSQKVTEINPGPATTTYHLHVADPNHNYFAGGLLGHNMKTTL